MTPPRSTRRSLIRHHHILTLQIPKARDMHKPLVSRTLNQCFCLWTYGAAGQGLLERLKHIWFSGLHHSSGRWTTFDKIRASTTSIVGSFNNPQAAYIRALNATLRLERLSHLLHIDFLYSTSFHTPSHGYGLSIQPTDRGRSQCIHTTADH